VLQLVAGNQYFNVTDLCWHLYNGTTWGPVCGGAGSGFVLQVNGTPISPSTPGNLIDSDTVTITRSGNQVSFHAAGGTSGCEVNSPGDCVITDPTLSQNIVQPTGTQFSVQNSFGNRIRLFNDAGSLANFGSSVDLNGGNLIFGAKGSGGFATSIQFNGFLSFPGQAQCAGSCTLTWISLFGKNEVQIDASGGAATVILPSANGPSGAPSLLWVSKNEATSNTITLQAATGDTINGVSTFAMSTPFEMVQLMSSVDDNNWYVIGAGGGGGGSGVNGAVHTSSWTLVAGQPATANCSSACTATIPASISTGFSSTIVNVGAGNVTITSGGPTYDGTTVIPTGANIGIWTDGTNYHSSIPTFDYLAQTLCTPPQSTDSTCTGTYNLPAPYANGSYASHIQIHSSTGAFIYPTITSQSSTTISYSLTCTFNCSSIPTNSVTADIQTKHF
jgi:hypothetical protein